ncbi:cytochrome P450 9e2-like [Venturia canescens]|uniref:cytochrome P450 9e2-like n=1 Tax=Venturia canescens TaxID=32260 RepID=UPI001C9D5F0A|nr:cytochrome P450 9e2-like [Venturia canescens]
MSWLTIVLSSLMGLLAIFYFFFRKLKKFEKLGILHLRPWPVFGNMGSSLFKQRLLADVIDEVYKLNEDAKYVGFYDFGEPVVVIKSPDLIKNVAIKHFDYFVDHRGFVHDAEMDPFFGNNLFSLRGDKWKETRNLLSPAFTGSKMRMMFKLMSDCGKNFAQFLTEQSSSLGSSEIDAKDAFMRYTNDVIATCAFGISIDSMRNRKNEFFVLGKEVVNFEGSLSTKLFLLRSFPRISKIFGIKLIDPAVEDFFINVVRETVETREREGITRPDMIQLMMETRKNNTGQGLELSMMDMASEAFIFFLGGFDTTATLMCFAAHQIAANPLVQQKLCNEIDHVLETVENAQVTYDAINEMEYLDAILNETLRLYPPGFFLDRLCVKPYQLPPALPGEKPITIQPGESVWFPVYSINRDSKYFDDPDRWDPERFLGARKNRIDLSIYLPFGLGPRMCIGNRFALLETKVMLFHLLSKCHIKPGRKAQVPLKLKKSFIITAEGGFWLEIEPRNISANNTKDFSKASTS